MKLSLDDLTCLARIASGAAKKAGEMISSKHGTRLQIHQKEDGAQGVGSSQASQVLTEVDLLSQEIILEALKPTIETYDLALLSEEKMDDGSRHEKDYFWCIDPLDGTLPFISLQKGYSVSIALVSKQGVPVIGVVYDPEEQRMYYAIKGQGALRNGIDFKVKHHLSSELTFINDRSFLKLKNAEEVIELVRKICSCAIRQVMHGGAAMNAIWVAENAPSCYIKFPKKENGGGSIWDFAASACILKEAGAHVSDVFGHELHLNPHGTTFMNQKGILFVSNAGLAEKLMFASILRNTEEA